MSAGGWKNNEKLNALAREFGKASLFARVEEKNAAQWQKDFLAVREMREFSGLWGKERVAAIWAAVWALWSAGVGDWPTRDEWAAEVAAYEAGVVGIGFMERGRRKLLVALWEYEQKRVS